MAAFYPVFLDLRGKAVLIVGGGVVAERKVEQLLPAGPAITVISPVVTTQMARWAADRAIAHLPRPYEAGDTTGASLVIAATDDVAVNRTVADAARAERIWVNAVDDVAYCDFIAPAVVEQGDITVAVSTGGKSPATARFLRRQLEAFLSADFAVLLGVAEEARLRLRREGLRVPSDEWQTALDDGILELVRGGRTDAARALLYDNLVRVKVG
ncbi:MAG: bifunctional precorrin-2 dehydrogenase/sirohydrochlorin ferrochelatase [Dehalococcoidia bacterium]|nr:bifunctional precorrin-2 dehydrogenase/sirohydrochlorin ferrochelatase [Dehalococcoidia bacterium]